MEVPQFFKTLHWSVLTLLSAALLTLIILSIVPTHQGMPEHRAIISSLYIPQELVFLDENEASHMRDVTRLIEVAFIVYIILCILIKYNPLQTTTYMGVRRTIFTIVGIEILLTISGQFTTLWNIFHYIFFPQGNWQFPMDSMLITLYPESYFLGAALIFTGILLVLLRILAKATILLKHKKKEKVCA